MPHLDRALAVGENPRRRLELHVHTDQLEAIDARRGVLGAGQRRTPSRAEVIRSLLDAALGLTPPAPTTPRPSDPR